MASCRGSPSGSQCSIEAAMFENLLHAWNSDGKMVVTTPRNCFGRSATAAIEEAVRWCLISWHDGASTHRLHHRTDRAPNPQASARRSGTEQQLFKRLITKIRRLRSFTPSRSIFATLFKRRDPEAIRHWIRNTIQCGIGPFAWGLQRDLTAVVAAVETEWSSGQVEGQINRLKTIKRQMYGRAGFAMLRRSSVTLVAHTPP